MYTGHQTRILADLVDLHQEINHIVFAQYFQKIMVSTKKGTIS